MRALLPLMLFAVLATACEKDDEDLIDDFVAAVTGEVNQQRVEHVLATYVDPSAEELDVRVYGETRLYRAQDAAKLAEHARTRLTRLHGRSLNAVRRRIEIKGDQAFVELQLMGRDVLGNVRYELRKRGGRWLLGTVALQ